MSSTAAPGPPGNRLVRLTAVPHVPSPLPWKAGVEGGPIPDRSPISFSGVPLLSSSSSPSSISAIGIGLYCVCHGGANTHTESTLLLLLLFVLCFTIFVIVGWPRGWFVGVVRV